MNAGKLVGTIALPPEWAAGATITRVEPVARADVVGGMALLVMVMLSDDSNIMALTYPKGCAHLRIAPMGTVVEMLISGDQPASDPIVEKMWGVAIESMNGALDAAREEFGV